MDFSPPHSGLKRNEFSPVDGLLKQPFSLACSDRRNPLRIGIAVPEITPFDEVLEGLQGIIPFFDIGRDENGTRRLRLPDGSPLCGPFHIVGMAIVGGMLATMLATTAPIV